jgi:nicotinate-nucleotide adenylyltransferase
MGLHKVIFSPAGKPPFKATDLIDARHRYAMTELAVQGNVYFEATDIEIGDPEISYTVNTLKRLRDLYPTDEILFLLGVDAFLDIPHWRQPEELTRLADFAVMTRPGYEMRSLMRSPYIDHDAPSSVAQFGEWDTGRQLFYLSKAASEAAEVPFIVLKGGRRAYIVAVTPLDISATTIRELIRSGTSVKYLLPDVVEQYIHTNGIYKN